MNNLQLWGIIWKSCRWVQRIKGFMCSKTKKYNTLTISTIFLHRIMKLQSWKWDSQADFLPPHMVAKRRELFPIIRVIRVTVRHFERLDKGGSWRPVPQLQVSGTDGGNEGGFPQSKMSGLCLHAHHPACSIWS